MAENTETRELLYITRKQYVSPALTVPMLCEEKLTSVTEILSCKIACPLTRISTQLRGFIELLGCVLKIQDYEKMRNT